MLCTRNEKSYWCISISNITYSVLRKLNDMEATLEPLLEELQKERNFMDRTLIFYQKYYDMLQAYTSTLQVHLVKMLFIHTMLLTR